jgi:hypothetical protein
MTGAARIAMVGAAFCNKVCQKQPSTFHNNGWAKLISVVRQEPTLTERGARSVFAPFWKWKTICSLADFCRAVRAKQRQLGRGALSRGRPALTRGGPGLSAVPVLRKWDEWPDQLVIVSCSLRAVQNVSLPLVNGVVLAAVRPLPASPKNEIFPVEVDFLTRRRRMRFA